MNRSPQVHFVEQGLGVLHVPSQVLAKVEDGTYQRFFGGSLQQFNDSFQLVLIYAQDALPALALFSLVHIYSDLIHTF